MAAATKASAKRHEVILQIPDLGLSKPEITALKKSFKSHIVSTMRERRPDIIVIIIIRVRVVRAQQQF